MRQNTPDMSVTINDDYSAQNSFRLNDPNRLILEDEDIEGFDVGLTMNVGGSEAGITMNLGSVLALAIFVYRMATLHDKISPVQVVL